MRHKINQKIEDIAVATNVKSNRIVALDIIRGWFLIVILINHIELYPSGFDYLTGRGRLFVSAAEGFFFMSGLLVGMVYRRRLTQGIKFIFKKMWTRALELYLASIFFTLLFTAAAVFLNHQTIKYGLYNVINWPHIIKETVLMRYGYGWADFLDRFAILMFIAPITFYLLAVGRWWLMISLSFVVWLAGQRIAVDNFTMTWQFLFNLAMLTGFYWQAITDKWYSLSYRLKHKIKLWVIWLSAISFSLSYASVYLLSVLNEKLTGLPHWLYSLTLNWNTANAWVWQFGQKWTMGPLRIVLFLLWFATLFMFVHKYSGGINRRTKHLVELLGRNSLLVYIIHAFVVFAFKLFIPTDSTLWVNFIITAGALVCLFVVTLLYKAYEDSINAGVNHAIRILKRPFIFWLPAKN